jgi:hypothetical protein
MFSVAAADDEAKVRLRAFLDKRAQKVTHGDRLVTSDAQTGSA